MQRCVRFILPCWHLHSIMIYEKLPFFGYGYVPMNNHWTITSDAVSHWPLSAKVHTRWNFPPASHLHWGMFLAHTKCHWNALTRSLMHWFTDSHRESRVLSLQITVQWSKIHLLCYKDAIWVESALTILQDRWNILCKMLNSFVFLSSHFLAKMIFGHARAHKTDNCHSPFLKSTMISMLVHENGTKSLMILRPPAVNP